MRFFIHALIIYICLLFGSVATLAGPTTIRDERVTDPGVTPALGRGYSLATSSFQSVCLKNISKTKPSYNFQYKFEQLNENGSRSSKLRANFSSSASANYGWNVTGSNSGQTTTDSQTTKKTFRIIVSIVVDVYYASVDESATTISDPARELLEKKDIPGFFDGCGPYYVRSIGRFSKFSAMFSYVSETGRRDTSFESKLEREIKSWGALRPAYGGEAKVTSEVDTQLRETMSRNELKIDVAAWGLGKDKDAKLISTDVESFKAAIQDAFLSMQDEDTGMVTSVEVVPWIENTEFQRYVGLKEEDGIPLYLQKRILNQNAEFMAETDRALRNRLNIYYKAKLCQTRIAQDYCQEGNIENQLKERFAEREVFHNRDQSEPALQLEELRQQVTKAAVDELQNGYDDLLTGEGGGVVKCIKDLSEAGITKKSYREVESCQQLETKMAAIQGQLVNDYCLPRLK